MNEQVVIGPVKDIKDLVEVLPLVRKLSSKGPSVALSPKAAFLEEFLKGDPHIRDVFITDDGNLTIDLRRTDPYEECLQIEGPYTFPWIYIPAQKRAEYQGRFSARRGPLVSVLKDGLSHHEFVEIKTHLREALGIEPEILSFEKGSIKEALSLVVVSAVVISSALSEALLVPATGTALVIVSEKDDQARERFRAFMPGSEVSVRDEFGPVVRICALDRDSFVKTVDALVPKKRALFFDRDGTLCEDVNYLNKIEDLKVFPEVDSLRLMKDRGFLLIGVTNQSGIARGIVQPEVNKQINDIFLKTYGFDDFYHCPHHPEEHCACRKPSAGMLLKARRDHCVDLRQSIVVGDKDADTLLAKAVGAKAVLVTTGQQKDSLYADMVIQSLLELQDILST